MSTNLRSLTTQLSRSSPSHVRCGNNDENEVRIPLQTLGSSGAALRSSNVTDEHFEDGRTPKTSIPTWSPYTLNLPFLSALAAVALILCLVAFLLWWRSATNYGLGTDNGSSVLLFGWRYSPTMIAVIYAQMTTVLLADMKRTEPYARLARPQGAEASTSILKAPGAWWNALYDGFAKKRNGSRSWALICAAFLNILGFMVISPLSSIFLFSESVTVPKAASFIGISQGDSLLPIELDRTANFRTIASLLQNTSTSPWITDQYTMFPFWPAGMQDAQFSSLPANLAQEWRAETTVVKSNFTCTAMSLESQRVGNMVLEEDLVDPSFAASFLWSSSDGCKYGIATGIEAFEYGCSSWSNTSTFYNARGLDVPGSIEGTYVVTNQTDACAGKELIFVTDAWKLAGQSVTTDGNQYWNSKGAHMRTLLCDTKYYMANVSTSVSLVGSDPNITFSENEFEEKKVVIPSNILNITQFDDLMLSPQWIYYMFSLVNPTDYDSEGYTQQGSYLGGPSLLLGALYNYNMTLFATDPDLVDSAARTKQRYLGEVLQSALAQQQASRSRNSQGHVHYIETRVVVQAATAVALGASFFISFLLALAILWFSRQKKRPLNLTKDPATTMGVAFLFTHDKRSTSGFEDLRQPTDKQLHRKLDGEWFYTNPDGLVQVQTTDDDLGRNNVSQSKTGAPKIYQIPLLLTLAMILISIIVGTVVLYHFSITTALYEKAFVYDLQLSFFGNGFSTVAPFALIPTVVALFIGLWWGAMDETFRCLQPFLAMSKDSQPWSKGADLSYQSTFWAWACLEALRNKHWLLALVTLGTTITPIFTTSMSALFERGPGVVSRPLTLHRSLEICDIPHVIPVTSESTTIDWNYAANGFLSDLFYNLSSSWMYAATIQLTLNKTQQPAWSKDGWAFVPVDTSTLVNMDVQGDLEEPSESVVGAPLNVSLTTPAIRGRIECSQPPAEAFTNTSNWLTPKDLRNHTYWNSKTIPDGLESGYKLGYTQTYESYSWMPALSRWILPLTSPEEISSCIGCTTVLSVPEEIACCTNGSSGNNLKSSVAVGYWSPNTTPETFSWAYWQRNFTVKWIRGDAVSGIRSKNLDSRGEYEELDLLFVEPPSITLLTCKPILESTTAEISMNPENGEIQGFDLVGEPEELSSAFADNFLPYVQNVSSASGAEECNATLSLGHLFMISLLSAAKLNVVTAGSQPNSYTVEDAIDNTYNIRDENNGLNMDFMTYSMYKMANEDPDALLDPTKLKTLAERTFTTFFQHFASNDVSLETGSWAFQKINASLPTDLGTAVKMNNSVLMNETAAQQDTIHPISHTNRTAEATFVRRVEVLQMNSVAVWLSTSIMGWLVLTTVLVAIFQRRYFGSLVRGVECLGDVLVLIADSPNLLQVVRRIQSTGLQPSDYKYLRTRLGWFIDTAGKLRWGIEMDGPSGDGLGVQWVGKSPSFLKENGSKEWILPDNDDDYDDDHLLQGRRPRSLSPQHSGS